MSTIDIHRGMLNFFIVLFDTTAFKIKFHSLELAVRSFLEWVAKAAVTAMKVAMETMKVKTLRRRSELRQFQFLKTGSRTLCGLGAEQI